ncbi:antibiotic biosynthesis monooxygenase family protein [Pseudomonas sp. BP8]|uniref:putative quinol monooxygenase n=1 Tax=Pseudomonas sp. BP8 TaxID=2817864 RepID=UPI001AE5FE66|nr:antibiotic biosynthesis monooxygenase family protein [Pseudomonas sp. BP8]MBP2262368.1 quinol monooxygenase YgiN [Pseudomonas sp. BP8]HDS1733284.1 antibiotic biosynthesis monooxygenase [Pseudomonas putida]
MAIECVNTIEIQLPEGCIHAFAEFAQAHVLRLQKYSGCHDYVLVQSSQDESRWWLSGYWESKALMESSFEGAAMAALLDDLIQKGASLSFGSFIPQMAKSHGR